MVRILSMLLLCASCAVAGVPSSLPVDALLRVWFSDAGIDIPASDLGADRYALSDAGRGITEIEWRDAIVPQPSDAWLTDPANVARAQAWLSALPVQVELRTAPLAFSADSPALIPVVDTNEEWNAHNDLWALPDGQVISTPRLYSPLTGSVPAISNAVSYAVYVTKLQESQDKIIVALRLMATDSKVKFDAATTAAMLDACDAYDQGKLLKPIKPTKPPKPPEVPK